MPAASKKVNTIDDYIQGFPPSTQAILQKVRACIFKTAPQASEKMAYGIPTFFLHKNLVHFAGYEKHIGFYPAPSGIAQFRKELAAYKSAKGSVQFPLDQPIPYALIEKIVRFRVQENLTDAG